MGFVENVNKLAGDLTADLVSDANIVAGIADDISEIAALADAGVLPLIDDAASASNKVYSSEKTQAMHDSQAEAIANLSSASGSLQDDGTDLVLTTTNQSMTFDPVIATTNALLFEVKADEIDFKSNGVYNFFSSVTLRLNTNATRTITFEVYDKATTTTVYATTVGTINGSNGDIVSVQLNTLLDMTAVPFGGTLTTKVRAKLDVGDGSVTLLGFNSLLILSGAASGGGQLLGKAPIKAVGYLGYETAEDLVIPSGANGYSIGSLVINEGGSLTIPDESIHKII